MSTASDLSAFEHSVEPAAAEVLFSNKKWTYIQDSSSTSGQYNGQIQLNLQSISSQAAFVNWQEAVIQLPIKLQILAGSGFTLATDSSAMIDQLVPKAGSWQFIDSVSVVIDGVTVQTNQIHENVNATIKALTEWDLHDLNRYGATSQFALDKYAPSTPGGPQSLENVATGDYITSQANIGEFGLANTVVNAGARERSLFTAVQTTSGALAADILGGAASASSIAKPLVYVAPAGTIAAGAPLYVAHYVATIRLADVCDYFKKCPMSKNAKGFIYINYNSSITTLTTTATAGNNPVNPKTAVSFSTGMNYGNTCPIMYNTNSALAASTTSNGVSGLKVPASTTLQITADVDGTGTPGSGLTPSQKFTRLLVPTYTPNPTADQALVQKKSFRYFERFTNKFTVQPEQSFNYTLTNGISNPKKLFMLPIITNPVSGATVSDTINPLRSCLTTVPATTSAFAALKALQVTVGNVPIWNAPVNFGYDMFVQELRDASGADCGLDDTHKAGLLSQQDWESLYRIIPVDIGRRLPSEDGASKAIQVTGVNTTKYALTVYYHVWRDAIATVDTSMGTISQGATQV
ncbi:unnamed protein product [Phytophthora lilii]|uniref:Unnamed protein product n=1 Tax=Phytophthora lilii TaxID=2077276 RepID=A0A9W7CR11_9STRA|nr:unnamed protein product [Phytophthora lilii]